jgi:transcriptional regulator NrdR family protein
MTKLPDPERCPQCRQKGAVVDSRMRVGYRRRLHRCATCKLRWPSYQYVISPKRAIDAIAASI